MKRKIPIIILLLILSLLLSTYCFMDKDDVSAWVEYTIKSGDTLWEIADDEVYNHHRPNKVLHDIYEKNNCDAEIYPGQTILIPVYKK